MKHFVLTLLIGLFIFSGCRKDDLHALATKLPANSSPKVVPTVVILGSSTAAGFGATPIDSSWVSKLSASVNANGRTAANFVNLAYGGYTTYNVLPAGCNPADKPAADTARNITKALSYKPALVMISLPNNDVANGYTNYEIVNNYKKITHLLDSAKVQYIIFSTQPRDFSDVNQRMQLKTLNDTVKTVYGNHVNDFLDKLSTSTYCIKPGLEYGDGIHLNNAGHAIIFNSTLQHPLLQNALR